jgi:hypothetical protein
LGRPDHPDFLPIYFLLHGKWPKVWGKRELVFGNKREASIEAIGQICHSLMNHPLSANEASYD